MDKKRKRKVQNCEQKWINFRLQEKFYSQTLSFDSDGCKVNGRVYFAKKINEKRGKRALRD